MTSELDFEEELLATELASEALLSRFTRLMQAAQAKRESARLKFGEVQAVYADISEAMNLHLRGRHHLMRAHGKSLEIGQRNGLIRAVGDTIPTWEEARDTPRPLPILRQVA